MAAEPNNSNMDVNKVVRAQAIWRGALVRKYFRQIRHSYEEIVQEIDNDQKEVGVEWTSSLVCKPKVYFGKKPQKRDNVGRVCGISSTLGQVVSVIPMAEQPFNVVFDETLDCNEDSGNEEQMNNVENDVYQDCGLQTPSPGGLNGRRILGEIKDSPGIDEKSGSESNLLGAFRNSQVDKENQSPVPQIQARIHSDIGFEIHVDAENQDELEDGRDEQTGDVEEKVLLSEEEKPEEHVMNSDKGSISDAACSDENVSQLQIEIPAGSEDDKNLSNGDLQSESETPKKKTDNVMEVTKDGDVTSLWGTEKSFVMTDDVMYPDNVKELQQLRSNVAMELLWVQQAIVSRKNYLKIKKKLGENQESVS